MQSIDGGLPTPIHPKLLTLETGRKAGRFAWTLTEAVMALALLGIGLSGIFVANSRVLTQLRSIRQTSIATQALQERVDQVRRATWNDLTNSTYLRDKVLAQPSTAGSGLPGLVEEIDIGAYPPPPGTRIRLPRLTDGSLSILSVSPNLGTQTRAVSVFIRLTWNGNNGVSRRRECATIIAKGGITK